jgi:hypothetical protein
VSWRRAGSGLRDRQLLYNKIYTGREDKWFLIPLIISVFCTDFQSEKGWNSLTCSTQRVITETVCGNVPSFCQSAFTYVSSTETALPGGWTTGGLGFHFRQNEDRFLFTTVSRAAVGSIQTVSGYLQVRVISSLPTQNTSNTRHEHACPQRDSNPQSQPSCGSRPTP